MRTIIVTINVLHVYNLTHYMNVCSNVHLKIEHNQSYEIYGLRNKISDVIKFKTWLIRRQLKRTKKICMTHPHWIGQRVYNSHSANI